MKEYVLDTNIGLHVLHGTLLTSLPTGHYSISAVTEIELFSKPNLSIAERRDIQSFLSKLTIVELPQDVRDEAARIRRDQGLKLPDAIIAATALAIRP